MTASTESTSPELPEAEPAPTSSAGLSDLSDPGTCPRCGEPLTGQPFYGPCGTCRDALRAELGGSARDVAAGTYEPKMNVTPNAVALKDD